MRLENEIVPKGDSRKSHPLKRRDNKTGIGGADGKSKCVPV
jgi:hypothetical protein